MAQKDLLLREKLDYSGIFNFSGLYKYMYNWLNVEEDYGVVEEKYSEKISGNSKGITIEWVATKKMGSYFKVEIKVTIEASDLVDVEVETDGQKKKMQKGKVAVTFKGFLVKDPSSDWEGKPFDTFIRGWYDKFVIPQTIDTMEQKVHMDVKGLKDDIKAYLELSGKR